MHKVRTGQLRGWPIVCSLILFVCLGTQPSLAQTGTPTLSCRLNEPSAPIGGQAELLLEIQNVQNFYGYELTLVYDPNVVEILDGDPNREQVNAQLGDFLSQGFLMLNEINEPGELLLNLMQIDPTPARAGSGLLARITLIGRQYGTANFTITNLFLYDANGAEIAAEVENCSLQIAQSAVAAPTATVLPPTATATSSPTVTPVEMTTTATATLAQYSATEPILSTPTATVQAAMGSETSTPTVAQTPSPPSATLPGNVVNGGALSTQPVQPSATAQEVVTSTPTVPVGSTPIAPLENSADSSATTSNEPTEPTTGAIIPTHGSLWFLFLPYISEGGKSTQKVIETGMERVMQLPAGEEHTSSLLSADRLQGNLVASVLSLATATDLVLLILPFGIFAVGVIGFELLVLIAGLLLVCSRSSQRELVVHHKRRLKNSKIHL